MQDIRQSTAATVSIGPCLDASGVEYTGLVIGDLSIRKHDGSVAALAAAATLTHSANGVYTLVFTTGNTDTIGRLQIHCNKSTYQIPLYEAEVLHANVYDVLYGSTAPSTLGGTAQTGDSYARIGTNGAGLTGVGLDAAQRVKLAASQPDYAPSKAGDAMTLTSAERSALAVVLEAFMLDEGDASALLAAIAAKVEQFLINEGDATATLAAIATSVRTNLAAELARILLALPNFSPGSSSGGLATCTLGPTGDGTILAQRVRVSTSGRGEISNVVWDAALADHLTTGTTGKALSDALAGADPGAVAAAVLGASAPGGYPAGTVGFKIGRLGTAGATYPDDIPEPGETGLIWGDTYSAALGNRKQFQSPPGFPDPAGKTVTLGVGDLNAPKGTPAIFTTDADSVSWDSGTGVVTALFPISYANTTALDPDVGRYGGSWEVDYGTNLERTGGVFECVVTRKYSD